MEISPILVTGIYFPEKPPEEEYSVIPNVMSAHSLAGSILAPMAKAFPKEGATARPRVSDPRRAIPPNKR